MRIERINCYEVVVPVHDEVANSREYGPAVFDSVPKIVFEALTDKGITGFGETPRGVGEQYLTQRLLQLRGRDISNISLQDPPINDLRNDDMFAHENPLRRHRLNERFFGAADDIGIHAMLFDLLGKKQDVPAHRLIGGACRDRIRADYWMRRMTPEDSARACKLAQSNGYLGVKCKCALEDQNVERAQAVKEACGAGFKMTFDPNCRFYRYGEAVEMLRALAQVGNVGCIEDPFPSTHLSEFRLLREKGWYPVAVHTGYGPTLLEAIRIGACDYVNLGDLPWRTHLAAGLCWIANVATWHGSGADLGILESLALHVCAASRSMSLPCDVYGRTLRRHNLIDNSFKVEKGTIAVPTGPGLGVSIDRDALDRHTIRNFTIDLH
jgi:muconate cycloisomerase